jgi:hypothetical protein
MKQKAIVVYLDNSGKMQEEFSWLWKSWQLYSLEDEFDLVVYYNPEAKHRLDNFPGIISIEMPYIRIASAYKFLNSHYFCLDEWSEPLKKYRYILKTDCDVFLTEHLKNFTPSKFLVGAGGYYSQGDDKKIKYIKHLSSVLGLNHNNMTLVGASFFGKASEVISVVKNQALITERIISNFSNTKEFEDSGFNKGIASMIAGEIFINHVFVNQHVNLYCLDSRCWKTSKIGKDTIHIHAWHTDLEWSKHKYFRGEYTDWKVDLVDAFKNSSNYCHWIATMTSAELSKFKESYKNNKLDINYDLS